MNINNKPVMLRDRKALGLIKKRAQEESRSAANAAAVTIIEALGGENNDYVSNLREKNSSKFIQGGKK